MSEWTAERIGQLMDLVADGVTFKEIGHRMGISKNTAIGKARRMEFVARPDAILNYRQYRRRTAVMHVASFTERMDALDVFPKLGRCVMPLPTGAARVTGFCGAGAIEGKPYCHAHMRLTHQAGSAT